MNFIFSVLIFFSLSLIHLICSPFTKVEESFNLHGIHDYLHQPHFHAWAHQGDHTTFSGPIPRTFLGSILIGFISSPLISFFKCIGLLHSKFGQQIIARAVLAVINTSAIAYFGLCARHVFGNAVGTMTILLSSFQFHLSFYASRTLPNMFAFPLVQLGLGLFMVTLRRSHAPASARRRILRAGSALTLAAIIFRLELLALLAPLTLLSLLSRSVSIWEVITRGFLAVFAALEITVPIDSYFWQKFTWPEGASVYFNVIEGHSEDWGVMPWHYYFTSSLPKLLGLGYPIGLIGFFLDRKAFLLGASALMFVGSMSILRHKEWRFLIYIVPIWNLSTCVCVNRIGVTLSSSRNLRWFLFWCLASLTAVQTIISSYVSMYNYPGGQALVDIHTLEHFTNLTGIRVHIDDLAAQTGASRFMQLDDRDGQGRNWTYDKLADLSQPESLEAFDVIITERELPSMTLQRTTPAFDRLQLRRPPSLTSRWRRRDSEEDGRAWALRLLQGLLPFEAIFDERRLKTYVRR